MLVGVGIGTGIAGGLGYRAGKRGANKSNPDPTGRAHRSDAGRNPAAGSEVRDSRSAVIGDQLVGSVRRASNLAESLDTGIRDRSGDISEAQERNRQIRRTAEDIERGLLNIEKRL